MEEKTVDELEEQEKGKDKKVEEKLSICSKAPSAEHARAYDDDEPCDDGRSGNTDND